MFHQIIARKRLDPTGGACVGHEDPDLWHSQNADQIEMALTICADCKIVKRCRNYAMKNDERLGIWGGTTPIQRGHTSKTRF